MNTFIKIPVNDPYFKALKDAVDDWEQPTDLLANLIEWEYDRAQVISYIHSDKGCICGKEADPAELLRQLREYFSPTYEYRAKRMWQMRAMSAILAAANNFVDWIRDWPTHEPQSDNEARLKTAAIAFLVQKGLYDEFEDFLHNPDALKGETVEDRIKIAELYVASRADGTPVPSEAVAPQSDTVCVDSEALNNIKILTAMVKDLHAEQVHNEKLLARCRDLMRARGISEEEINQQSE